MINRTVTNRISHFYTKESSDYLAINLCLNLELIFLILYISGCQPFLKWYTFLTFIQ